MRNKTSGRGLIEIIVVAALLLVAVLVYVNGGFKGLTGDANNERADGVGETIVGKSIAASKDTKCQSNVKQLRASIEIATDPVEEIPPQTLEETRLGSDYYKCPLGNEPYQYDPQTGTVKCVHPGHENY